MLPCRQFKSESSISFNIEDVTAASPVSTRPLSRRYWCHPCRLTSRSIPTSTPKRRRLAILSAPWLLVRFALAHRRQGEAAHNVAHELVARDGRMQC